MTDILQSYAALLIPIIPIRLDIGMFRYIVERRGDKEAVSRIITNVLAVTVPLIVLVSAAMAVAIIFNVIPFQIATLFYFVSLIANDLISALVRGIGKNALFAIASTADIVFKLVFGVVFVACFKMGGFGLMLSLGLSSTISNLISIINIRKNISIKRNYLSKPLKKELVKFSAPMIVEGISFWIVNTSDRTVISLVLGTAANGVYAVANKLSNLINSLTTIFWMSWSEQASIAVEDKNYPSFVSEVFGSFLKIIVSVMALTISFVPLLFKIAVGPEFTEAKIYVPILLIGLTFSALSSFYGPVYLAFKKTKEIAFSTFLASVINLVIDLALIWFIGIWAAVISTLVAYLFVFLYRAIDTRKCVKIVYDKRIMIISLTLLATCTGLYYVGNTVTFIVNIVLAIIMSVLLNYTLIKKGIGTIRKKLHRK
jgi:O-antigen/teichoic acid export membrane protein